MGHSAGRRKYRVKSPIRFFIFITTVVLILTFCLYTTFDPDKPQATGMQTYKQVVVKCGDTVWDIAECECGKSRDTRSAVSDICDTNGISPEDIQAGDTLFVPVYDE